MQLNSAGAPQFNFGYYSNGSSIVTNFQPSPTNELNEALEINEPISNEPGVTSTDYIVNYRNGTSAAVIETSNGLADTWTYSGQNLTGAVTSLKNGGSVPSAAPLYSGNSVPEVFTGPPEDFGYDTYEILGDDSISDDAVLASNASSAAAASTGTGTSAPPASLAPLTAAQNAANLAMLFADASAHSDLLPTIPGSAGLALPAGTSAGITSASDALASYIASQQHFVTLHP